MASLQARHHPACALGAGRWRFKKPGTKGCTCPRGVGPVYHTHHRENGKPKYERVGLSHELAKRVLRALEDRLDEERQLAKLGARPKERKDATVSTWVDEWYGALTCDPNTKRSYKATVDYAKAAFGPRIVRTLDVGDVREYLATIRAAKPKSSESTLARHLRVLSACLSAAIPEYADENPVPLLHASVRPRPPKENVPTYYTDVELKRLWLALPDELPGAVFKALFRAAVATGMRQGELLALRWPDVKLGDSEIEIARRYNEGIGERARTKNDKTRTIDLTPEAVRVFEDWYALSGAAPDSEGLVFADIADGGHLVGSTITRQILYPALKRAEIPRVGEHGRKRNFHSFRHSYARISLQNGAEMTWVQRQLGHSSITLTVDLYGRWERKAEKRQARAPRLRKGFAAAL